MYSHARLRPVVLCSIMLGLAGDPMLGAKEPATMHEAVTPAKPGERPWMSVERWDGFHERFNKIAQSGGAPLVFFGDSITEAWANEGAQAWRDHFKKLKAANFGIGGDRTQHLLWRIEHGNFDGFSPKLIVLLIGTNNLGNGDSPEMTIDGVTAVVEKLREKVPDSKILILGIFPRGQSADDPYRASISQTNQALSKLADWQNVHYLDIGHEFLEGDGSISPTIMPDFLHLTPEGYERWAKAIDFKVRELMNGPDDDHVRLFNGTNLEGWVNDSGDAPDGWDVVDGHLAIVGRGEDAQTNRHFSDFDFQCEWKLDKKGGNSGIFYRWADYKVRYLGRQLFLGPEYQLVDDLSRGMRPARNDSTAAAVDMYGPSADKPVRPQGEWNHTRIVAMGDQVEHWLNGVRVVDYDIQSSEWKRRLARSKFARLRNFGVYQSGTIRLQNQSGWPVVYRDLIIRPLDDQEPQRHTVSRPSS